MGRSEVGLVREIHGNVRGIRVINDESFEGLDRTGVRDRRRPCAVRIFVEREARSCHVRIFDFGKDFRGRKRIPAGLKLECLCRSE